MFRVKCRGVRCGVARSSKVRCGAIDVRYGPVVCSGARQCILRSGLVFLGLVRPCTARLSKVRFARFAIIEALRGLVLHGTILSCPVRYRKVRLCEDSFSKLSLWQGTVRLGEARQAKLLLWCSGVESGSVGSSGALFSTVRCYCGLARSCCVAWGSVVRGLVLCGKVLSWFGEALFGIVERVGVLHGMVLHGLALLRRCVAWSREALYGVAKFGPVKYGYARLGMVLLRFGNVKRGFVSCGLARLLQSLLSLWLAVVRYSKAKCSLALLRRGQVWLGTVLSRNAWYSLVSSRLGHVLRCPVRLSSVMPGLVMRCIVRHGKPLFWFSEGRRGAVSYSALRYGNVRLQK